MLKLAKHAIAVVVVAAAASAPVAARAESLCSISRKWR